MFNLQPSEFAKVGVALVLAKFFGENRGAPTGRSRDRGALTAVPLVLIASEPDLGTAVTLLPVFSGSRMWQGCGCASSASSRWSLLAAPVAWKFALKEYQKAASRRSSTRRRMRRARATSRFRRAYRRVGGLTGKGFRKGTQGQLRFLPVAHNDFIFSALAEEQGFVGVLLVLGLYLLVIWRALEAGRLAKDRLGRISCWACSPASHFR